MFPAAGDEKQDLITIVGKQDAVEKAKQMLQQKVTELVSCLSCNKYDW